MQNTVHTGTHITKTLTQMSKLPHITKHIHTHTHPHTHTLHNPHIHTPTHTHTHITWQLICKDKETTHTSMRTVVASSLSYWGCLLLLLNLTTEWRGRIFVSWSKVENSWKYLQIFMCRTTHQACCNVYFFFTLSICVCFMKWYRKKWAQWYVET